MRRYDVAAVDAPLPMLDGDRGEVFVDVHDIDAARTGTGAVTPLVLRADVGDCIAVTLTNRAPGRERPGGAPRRRFGLRPGDVGRCRRGDDAAAGRGRR